MTLALHAVVAKVGQEAPAVRAAFPGSLDGRCSYVLHDGRAPEFLLRHVLLGHDEEHYWHPIQDILDYDDVFVFVDNRSWLVTCDDVAEGAGCFLGHARLPFLGVASVYQYRFKGELAVLAHQLAGKLLGAVAEHEAPVFSLGLRQYIPFGSYRIHRVSVPRRDPVGAQVMVGGEHVSEAG